MDSSGTASSFPVAATMDLQYRLPPFRQILYTPTIIASVILLVVAILVVVYLSYRSRAKARIEARLDALKIAEKILLKRGGTVDDVQRILFVFKSNPQLDPASIVMVQDNFRSSMLPLLEQTFDRKFAEHMENLYFPPFSATRHAINDNAQDVNVLIEERKPATSGQTAAAAAAVLDMMDATLHPGAIVTLAFDGIGGGHDCMVMGHNMQSINITLPANNSQLVAALRPGMKIEGTLESGPSLLAFTSSVIQAVAGSMPYARISAWNSMWEVRKRESIRLPIELELDFQHISTSRSESIKVSRLDKEIASVRPGRLMDISLGGCCIETPSSEVFRIGDMIRFSKSLINGSPPATLLGAIVNIKHLEATESEPVRQLLHVQFLIIDDVSQRILVRALRQLRDLMERDEWMQAQALLQKMRRNNIQNIGSPAGGGRGASRTGRRSTTAVVGRPSSSTARPGTRVRTQTGVDTRRMRRPAANSSRGTGIRPNSPER